MVLEDSDVEMIVAEIEVAVSRLIPLVVRSPAGCVRFEERDVVHRGM